MKPKLDVVIVATVRADILRMTLQSFCNHFLYQFDCRAIINVDPMGETDKNNQMDMVNICREYFDEVIYRTPAKPSFVGAMKWGWQQVETNLFFHLEDDWILKTEIDCNEITNLFKHENVVSVSIHKLDCAGTNIYLNHHKLAINWFDDLNLVFPTISFNPVMLRTAYIKQLANKLDLQKDPETQWNAGNNHTDNYAKPIFLWRTTNESAVIDTGSHWRKVNDIRKQGGTSTETHWQKHISKSFGGGISDKLRYANRMRKYYFIKRNWQQYCKTKKMNIPIYVISLARAIDRRADITARLKSAGMKFEIIDAVNGKELDLSTIKNRIKNKHLKRNEIGCFLSHYNLWQRMVHDKTPFALILEDDAEWDDDFFQIVTDLVQSRYYWNVINLASTTEGKIYSTLEQVGHHRQFVRLTKPKGMTAAHLIDLDGAKKLLKHCYEIQTQVDQQWKLYWQCNLYFYHVQPSPVRHDMVNSTIGEIASKKSKPQQQKEIGKVNYWLRVNKKRFTRRFYHWTHPPKLRK